MGPIVSPCLVVAAAVGGVALTVLPLAQYKAGADTRPLLSST
jgi:hypothetical protein